MIRWLRSVVLAIGLALLPIGFLTLAAWMGWQNGLRDGLARPVVEHPVIHEIRLGSCRFRASYEPGKAPPADDIVLRTWYPSAEWTRCLESNAPGEPVQPGRLVSHVSWSGLMASDLAGFTIYCDFPQWNEHLPDGTTVTHLCTVHGAAARLLPAGSRP